MVGAMMPKPTATKNEEKTRTPTSRGNSAKGLEGLRRAERFKLFYRMPFRRIESVSKLGLIALSLLREICYRARLS